MIIKTFILSLHQSYILHLATRNDSTIIIMVLQLLYMCTRKSASAHCLTTNQLPSCLTATYVDVAEGGEKHGRRGGGEKWQSEGKGKGYIYITY